MNMIRIIFSLAILFSSNVLFAQNWKRINKEIRKCQIEWFEKNPNIRQGDKACLTNMYKVREHFHLLHSLHVNAEKDTVFLLERHFVPLLDSSYDIVIWNKNFILDFSFELDYNVKYRHNKELNTCAISHIKVNCKKSRIYTSTPSLDQCLYMKYAERWDIKGIREQKALDVIPFPSTFGLTRIIFNGGKHPKYDYFEFIEFADPLKAPELLNNYPLQ